MSAPPARCLVTCRRGCARTHTPSLPAGGKASLVAVLHFEPDSLTVGDSLETKEGVFTNQSVQWQLLSQ